MRVCVCPPRLKAAVGHLFSHSVMLGRGLAFPSGLWEERCRVSPMTLSKGKKRAAVRAELCLLVIFSGTQRSFPEAHQQTRAHIHRPKPGPTFHRSKDTHPTSEQSRKPVRKEKGTLCGYRQMTSISVFKSCFLGLNF